MEFDQKQRVIQEYVPGKQVTLAHIIANPMESVRQKLGLSEDQKGAIGVLTITPSEAVIIAADVAVKTSGVDIGFLDRFSGSLVVVGDVSDVDAGLKEIINVLENVLHFTPAMLTRSWYGKIDVNWQNGCWKDEFNSSHQ